MTLDKLIKILQEIKKEVGNVPVVLSSDSEGNSWGTLKAPTSFCLVRNLEGDKVQGLGIYPFAEGFYDEFEALKYKGS